MIVYDFSEEFVAANSRCYTRRQSIRWNISAEEWNCHMSASD